MAKLKLRAQILTFLGEGNHTPLKLRGSEWNEVREDEVLSELISKAEDAQDAFRRSLEEIEEYLHKQF